MGAERDVRVGRSHLWLLLGAALLLFALTVYVDADHVDHWELDLATWINDAPSWLAGVLWPVMQLGSFWGPIVVGAVAAFFYGWERGAAVMVSGLAAWWLAKGVKSIVERGRPLRYIPDIHVHGVADEGFGFVSGHTAVAFAVATALMPVLPRWGRVVAYGVATIVGLARIVYGAHLPLDVVGGACLGIVCGAAVDLVLAAISPHPAPVVEE
jgi:undecaprenyl-diphosphatase